MTQTYDFIVVGAGASGCALAWRLASARQRPNVLIIEAGGKNDAKSLRVDGDRWISRMNAEQNWSYATVSQANLDGRTIDYDRGRGLGGSTAINFSCYTVGPAGDYDELARLVGDEDFSWTNASKVFKRLETYHSKACELPASAAQYLDPIPSQHGAAGPLQVGFAQKWEPAVASAVDACQHSGISLNQDMNSGDPIGVGVTPQTAFRGERSTAADFLASCPSNLTVLTNTPIDKLKFEGPRCVGVETKSQSFTARNEVVLSCGALDTPRILMHSGIGPAAQLENSGISSRVNLPGVGQNLRDHHHLFLSWEMADHTSERKDYYRSAERQAEAREQWMKDRTGPLAEFGTTMAMAWLKNQAIFASAEFASLPPHRQRHLTRPTVPNVELIFNVANKENYVDPQNAPTLFTAGAFVLNRESVGSCELQSENPNVPLRFDPNYFSSPFDKTVAIEATRELLKVVQQPEIANDVIRVHFGPSDDSEEEILAFWRKATSSTWHMSGTVAMGQEEQIGTCVNSRFQVVGTEALRVVDMSAVPLMMNCHTQAVAYCIGLIAGDKLAEEYSLDL